MNISCVECGVKNNTENNFCKACGSKLLQLCASCGFKNQPDANFCGGCGNNLTKNNNYSKPIAERRQLTVMFCDLVDSSGLAEQFDPEQLREILRSFQQCVADVVLQYGGHIAKYIGDGLLVYFGHPHAHEDDVRRSILSGLDIIDEIIELNKAFKLSQKVELKIRIGIHTGLVVIGEMGSGTTREENAIVGETANIGARLESLAQPNTVVISDATHELVKGIFVSEDLGEQQLKGLSGAIKIHKVIAESTSLSQFEVRNSDSLSKIIGRDSELDFLTQSWNQAKQSQGQYVWLSGEAGVGKSRVVSEFMFKLENETQHLRIYHCSSIHTNTAFYPIISNLKQTLNLNKDDTDEVKYKSLEKLLQGLTFPLDRFTPIFAPLIGIKNINKTNIDIKPEETKKVIIEGWIGLMEKLAEEHPLLLIFEDTHWVDPSTQELLDIISRKISDKRILLLITSRPEYQFTVDDSVELKSLILDRLGFQSSFSMISQLSGGHSLPHELVEELVSKADGIPLFIEEITKTVIGSNLVKKIANHYELVGPLTSLTVPNSLKDSLMALLDQLSEVKIVAQIAATIGRRFSAELLEKVSQFDEEDVNKALEKLLDVRLIVKSNKTDGNYYKFRHALLQDTAYESLLMSTRKNYHGLIADTLVKHFSSIAKEEPEVLALHCTEAGKTESAVSYWMAAGNHATLTSSNKEAISHFSKGIELLNSLPQQTKTFEKEFQIQVYLLGPLITTEGYVSPLVETAFTRATELSHLIETSVEIFPVLHGRYSFYQVCGLIDKAEKLVDEFFEIAKKHHDSYQELEMIANRLRGSSLLLQGDSTQAERYLKDSVAAYDFDKHQELNSLYGQDIKVAALGYLCLNQWHLGKIEEIKGYSDEAFDLAKKLSSANSNGIAYFVGKIIPATLLDNAEDVLQDSEKLLEIATAQEMPLWQVTSLLFKGWAMVRLNQFDEGMGLLEKGLTSYNAMRIGLFRPLIQLLYAQACKELGLINQGITTLKDSQEHALLGEHWLDAETHRFLGELYLLSADSDRQQALNEFQQALKVAQQQHSKTLELRAAMSLYHFYQGEDEKGNADEILQKAYDNFADKQCTKDLIIAGGMLSS